MAIGFQNPKGNFIKSMVIPKDFTNGIVFGRTGSGKTSCAILPNIEDRIKSEYGVLIYDFKGNLHLQAKYLANKYNKLSDVIEIGKPWGKKINLCDYLSLKQITMIIQTKSNDTYWDNASKNLLENAYLIYKNLYQLKNEIKGCEHEAFNKIKEISYYEIYKVLSTVENVSYFYRDASFMFEYISILVQNEKNYSSKKKGNIFELLNNTSKYLEALSIYKKVQLDDDSGKNAVVNHLSTILNQIATKDYLNTNDIDIIKELRAGKIVILDVSTFNENILDSINMGIYTRLQKATYKEMKPVSIIIDEAQRVLNAAYLPQTDVCRESEFEYLFAAQDRILLINKLGIINFEELYVNLITKYSFSTESDGVLEEFEFKNLSSTSKYYALPLYIDKKELLKVEYKYLKLNNFLDLVDFNSKKEYMFIYDTKLMEDYKIMVETIDDEIIEVDYLRSFDNSLKMKTNKHIA